VFDVSDVAVASVDFSAVLEINVAAVVVAVDDAISR
jgi:hypothetical protein